VPDFILPIDALFDTDTPLYTLDGTPLSMTITHGYTTRDDLAGWLTAAGVEAQEGTRLDLAIEAASRWIDDFTGRFFYQTDTAETRLYRVCDPYTLEIGDIATTDELAVGIDSNNDGTYSTSWTDANYYLEPLNGIYNGSSGWPFFQIVTLGTNAFPYVNYSRRPAVQITAKWGWAAVPKKVEMACLILAGNLWRRKDAPFAIVPFVDAGMLRIREDPDVQALLAPYVRRFGIA
jgi:hypothetical protein